MIKTLSDWNPWWENPKTIEVLQGKSRPEYISLLRSVSIKEITIITGVRRSGKSTLMYQMIKSLIQKKVRPIQILFVNLEDSRLEQTSLDSIYEEYKQNINPNHKSYIFFDEVHKRKNWESWVRRKYDQNRGEKFVISGSCSHLLKKEYATLLTGRNLTFEVFPLSFKEHLQFQNINIDSKKINKGIITEQTRRKIRREFTKYLTDGGFPEIVSKEKAYKQQILSQYFDDILYKDIIARYNLNSKKTKDLALYFLNNFTGIASLRKIRATLGLSYDTIKEYLSHFYESYLFFSLDHFSYKFKEQKSTASKIYCIDHGIRNAVAFAFSKDQGKIIENIVFIELLRRSTEFYYWEDKKELDFVIKNKDNSISLLDLTFTDTITNTEKAAIKKFEQKYPKVNIKEKIILTKDYERKENGITCIPLWKWLLSK